MFFWVTGATFKLLIRLRAYRHASCTNMVPAQSLEVMAYLSEIQSTAINKENPAQLKLMPLPEIDRSCASER